MKKHSISSLKFLIGIGFCVLAGSQLHAAVTYWDPQGAWPSGYYTGNMSGTWENKQWSTNYAGAGVSPTNWIESTAVCFGVGTGPGTPAFSVLMNGNHTVAGIFDGPLNPDACVVTVYGSGIMTIASGLQGFNIYNSSSTDPGTLTISNTIAGTGIFDPQNDGQIYLCGSNTWTGGTSLGYSGASWDGTVYFDTTNAFGTGTIYTSNCLGGALVMNATSALTITNPLFFPTPTSATLYLVGGSSGLTFAGPWTVNQAATLGIGSVNGPNQLTVTGNIGGTGALTITNTTSNTGTLTLTAPETYGGNLTIGSGDVALAATGSLVNSPTITIGAAGTFDVSAYSPLPYALDRFQLLTGSGTVNGDISVSADAKIAGGTASKIGTLSDTGSILLQSGGTNIVYLQNALTGPGVGNSSIIAANNIGVLASDANPFTIRLVSMTGTGGAGAVSNFDGTMSYSWTIATGDVTNFDAGAFVVDASAFANLYFGQFSVSSTGNALVLNYVPQANAVISSQFPSNNITLYQGQYLAPFSVTAGGQGPLTYQWLTNGVADTSLGTNSTYPMGYVQLQQSGTYQCVVTNENNSVTNELFTLTVLPWTSQYPSNLMTLEPAGYWPMHETESAARGDIETNYGTLGALANGYYPDWAGAVKSIQRGAKGAIVGDPDTAVYFTNSTSGITNALYVPHTSPMTTLTPPFSVECWFLPTNGQNDVWSQNGFEGLNAGASGAGNGKIGGIRLYAGGNGITVYTYNNSQTAQVPVSCGINSTNSWIHIVVTCDATTNFSLYTNGVLVASSGSVPAEYTPDSWTPFEVGNGRGNSRACAGVVDEVAIYTNVLQAQDVAAHYSDGLGGVAGQYFADVMASNPAVYLRMDAPAYTVPAASTWPILTNYGSAGVNGVYTPGTVPGILTGPNNYGFSYAGFTNVNVALLSGVSSFADAGNSPAYNPTGSNANFTVSAMFKGYPCDNRVQSIVGHGTNSWELDMSTNGNLVFNAGNATNISAYLTNQPASGSAAGDIKTIGVYNDGKWHQVVAVNQTNRVFIYVDGVLDTNGIPAGTSSTNVIKGISADLMIGADPCFTNSPVGTGRQFAGQICDVAFYNSALTATDVQGLYDSTGPPGTRFMNLSPNPSLTTAYGTATATFSGTVSAAGPTYPTQGETVAVAIPNVVTNKTTINDSTGDFTLTAPINTVPAGTYVITYSYLGSSLPPGTDTSTKLTITKAPVTVTANDQAKTYGQTITFGAGSTQFTDSGLQNGETIGTVTLAVSGSPAGGAPNAPVSGSPYTITPSAATGGTFTAGNYSITYDPGSLTVNPLPVALTGTRPYDGTATADFSVLSITNLVGTDVVTLVSGNVTLASSAPGTEPITSAAGLTLGGAQAGNYTTTGATGAVTVTVNPSPANILFTTANNVLTLSWPLDHTGWTLQAQTNNLSVGISTNWVDVAGSTTTNQIPITIDPNNPCVFYRLVYTP
ncbi:MAG TPA: LamG-like jellyroll fold domain-containing protein [Alphaproteobacteria bacterium]|nr:LamG-like jellyroll fold domain-containing protein [Alphaproteobacteria bacterium]